MELDNLGLLSQVMNKLLQPGVQISDDHVTKLLKYFTGMKDPVIQEIFNHFLQLWFTEAVVLWETRAPPCSEIFSLSLNIAVYLSSDESSFMKLNSKDLFQRFIRLLKLALKGLNASPNVGYVRLMISFLKHGAGVKWLLCESYWFEIVDLALGSDQDPTLAGECHNFIAELIEKAALLSSNSCAKILYRLIKTILDTVEVRNIRRYLEEEEFLKNCTTTINLLNEVLELIAISKNVTVYEHVMKFIDEYEFEDHAYVILQNIKNQDACYKLLNILLITSCLDFIYNCKGAAVIRPEKFWVLAKKTHRFRKEVALNRLFPFMQRILYNCIRIIDKIRDIYPKFIYNEYSVATPIEQVIHCQLGTIVLVSMKLFGEEYPFEGENDTCRDSIMTMYGRRIMPVSTYYLIELKNYMLHSFSFNDCISALKYILKSRQHFYPSEANIVLTFCMYNYEDVSHCIDDEIICCDPFALEYLACLIETITTFLIDFDPNWHDIHQGLTLINITLQLLVSSNSIKKIIINGLRLITIAVSKKLSLNMALLKDEMDEEMDQLLTIVVKKIDDENLEIQSEAIRVIESVSQSVGKDFLTFKSMFLLKQIPVKIARIAVERKNQSVRESAFKCLQEMAQIEEFWTDISTNCNIYEDVCQILMDDTPERVRREAAKLISIIYVQRDLPNAVLFRFYDVMTYSVIEDTDSDTKNNAFDFWINVIRRYLSTHGWIDGKFPEVTFSVDTKKIVILTDQEIRKRLVKVLFQLSEIGCLFILTTALTDQTKLFSNTIQVLRKELLQLLQEYKVDSVILDDMGYHKSVSFQPGFSYDSNMKIHKKKICRQFLHPNDFLESIDIFLSNSESNEIPDNNKSTDEQFDIVQILEEILYEGSDSFP